MRQPNKKSQKQTKPWHKKWWGITLLVLSVITITFPILLVIIMWQKNKLNMAARIGLTAIVVIVYVSAITASANQSNTQDTKTTEQSQESSQPAPKQEHHYEVKILGNRYEDPTARYLTFVVNNTGTTSFNPSCHITLENDAGTYRGTDYATWNTPLNPGESKRFEGLIIITNQGAAYATKSDVSCFASDLKT